MTPWLEREASPLFIVSERETQGRQTVRMADSPVNMSQVSGPFYPLSKILILWYIESF